MQDNTGDPLLHDLVQQIQGFDKEHVRVVMDLFSTTIQSAEAAGSRREETLWALTGVLVSIIRADPEHKLAVLALVQRMITLRMTWGEHLDANTTAVN